MAVSLKSTWQDIVLLLFKIGKETTSSVLTKSLKRMSRHSTQLGIPAWRFSLNRLERGVNSALSRTRKRTCATSVSLVESPAGHRRKRSRDYLLMLSICSFFFGSGIAWADPANTTEDSGFTVLSNAIDVTHWGLGVGMGVEPSPYRGDRARITPIPLFSIENRWVSAFATTLDLKVGHWEGVTLALRGRIGVLDGYRASDAPILNGMQSRDSVTFWYGPALGWKSGFGTLSASYLMSGKKGQQATAEFTKAFELDKWTIEPHADVRWTSDKYVDYYYGVTPSEARVGRPAYDGRSTLTTTLGTRISYQIRPRQSVSLDLQVTHLGSGISGSPLVGKRFIPAARLAYLYRFE